MNKTELTSAVAERVGLSLKDARATVDAIFATDKRGIISSELSAGRRVQITGFGTFETRKRKAREGRNPQTGDPIQIPASQPIEIAKRTEIVSIDTDCPYRGLIERADHIEQRRFAGTARPHDGDEFCRLNAKTHVVQRVYFFAIAVDFGQADRFNNGSLFNHVAPQSVTR